MLKLHVLTAVLLIAVPAAAQSWKPVALACSASLETQCEAIGGANCSGWWPSAAKCTIQNMAWSSPVDEARIDRCIVSVETERFAKHTPSAVGDPIAETIRCVSGRSVRR